jgi:hypothetical protein
MKASLNKDNRIKRDENYAQLKSIRNTITTRINLEYNSELKSLGLENEKLLKSEYEFYDSVWEILNSITKETKVKVGTQVGPGSSILNEYIGTVDNIPLVWNGQKYFDFISKDRDNDEKPFTIGFSCLRSIEVIQQ